MKHLLVVGHPGVLSAVMRLVNGSGLCQGMHVEGLRCGSLEEGPFLPDLDAAQRTYRQVARALDELPVVELRESAVLLGMPLLTPVVAGCLKNERQKDQRRADWDCLKSYSPGRDYRFRLSIETVVAWWMLAYPEVRWLWWTPGGRGRKDCCRGVQTAPGCLCSSVLEWHGLPIGTLGAESRRRSSDRWPPLEGVVRFFPGLFDPSGLRASIRGALGASVHPGDRGYQLCRKSVALAIDEEREYAQLAGYAAYRAGYRVWASASWRSFEYLWAWEGVEVPELRASFEDLYLSFPDQEGALPRKLGAPKAPQRLSCLRYRDAPLNGSSKCLIAESPHRVLMTVGHKRGRNGRRVWKDNVQHLRQRPGSWSVVRKPLGNVYRLLNEVASRKDRGQWRKYVRQLQHSEDGRHSAPGRLLAIAEGLIDRGGRILTQARNPVDALHAAALALEAKELLSGLTPTTTLEAIALQHEAEVTAESRFLGVQHNVDLRERFKEIAGDVNAVAYWFGRRHWVRSALNARLTITERLAQRLRSLNQVEEELACLAEARKLRFQFWVREKPWRWALWPFLGYVSFALKSLPRFILAVVCVCLFFGFSYYLFGALSGRADLNLLDAMTSGWKGFVTAETPPDWQTLTEREGADAWERFWNLWLSFQGAASLTNFGLLISHLYMLVSRR